MRNRREIDNVVFWLLIMLILFVGGAMFLKGTAKQTAQDVEENLIADEIEEVIEDAAEVAHVELHNDFYFSECKLSKELQQVVYDVCNDTGIPYNVALGLIEVESTFNVNALNKSTGCYGLCQLNPKYFPSDLTPAENIKTGLTWLARLYGNNGGDMAKALTVYNVGHDNGTRTYAAKVLKAAEKWG